MSAGGTLLLRRSDVARLLGLEECIAAVEQALRLHVEGKSLGPAVLGVHAHDGGFHIKAAGLELGRNYFAAKLNANFPGNPQRFGLPTIQGVIALCDATNGRPLALMDSMEITALRTGAVAAVAAKYLARPESRTVTVCGCGRQGAVQLRALACVLPLERAWVLDSDGERATRFAGEFSSELGFEVRATHDLAVAAQQSDVVITCTTAKRAFLLREHVRAGAFVAGVGADNPEKSELHPDLLAAGALVTDSTEQCINIGDLHHAIAADVLTREHVRAELHEVVAGRKPGRTSADEITIFDCTGTALPDVAAAAVVFEKAAQDPQTPTLALAN